MTLMVAGALFLAVFTAWHLGLAVRSSREASRLAGSATSAFASGGADRLDARLAAPYVLWLVLIGPTPATLAATLAIRLRPRLRTRVLVVDDRSANELPGNPDVHCLRVAAGLDRAELLNRASRFVVERSARDGEDPQRAVIGIVDEGTVPDEGLAVAVWQAFGDAGVGAVRARRRIAGEAMVAAVSQFDEGVLVDAHQQLRGSRGATELNVDGAFVRLSVLRRLGRNPWRSGSDEGLDLGQRLRRMGARIQHDPRLSLTARPATGLSGLLRQRTRQVQGLLQVRPAPGERAAWAVRLLATVLPGLAMLGILAWFAASGYWLASGASAQEVLEWDYPWWYVLPFDMLTWDTPSWGALGRSAGLWAFAALMPAPVWWVARRDLAAGGLVRAVLVRPLTALVGPVAFVRALCRQLIGRRTWRPPVRRAVPTLPVDGAATHPRDDLDRPVFVDTTGRRRKRVRVAAFSGAFAGVAYVVVLAFALVSEPIRPLTEDEHRFQSSNSLVQSPPTTPAPTPTAEPTIVTSTRTPSTPRTTITTTSGGGSPTDDETVPTEPVPTEPVPTEPVPTEPVPTEPVPTEPVPTEPVPTEPVPTEPVPTEPVSTEPAPTEPVPTEPVPSDSGDEASGGTETL